MKENLTQDKSHLFTTKQSSIVLPSTQLTYQHPWYLAVSHLENITELESQSRQKQKSETTGLRPTKLPTQERLQELFEYNRETGDLIWRDTGKLAGPSEKNIYKCVNVDKKRYQQHRIIWMYVYGEDPGLLYIDHIDRNKLNNSLDNLRLASKALNKHNSTHNKNNKLHTKGVRKLPSGRFNANIVVDYKQIGLGTFNTLEEASSAYQEASTKLWNTL